MIAAQNERCPAIRKRLPDKPSQTLAGSRDLRQIFGIAWARVIDSFRLRRGNVAEIGDVITESLKTPAESSDANRRRAHIDAPASRAEIERGPDDCDVLVSHGRGASHGRSR